MLLSRQFQNGVLARYPDATRELAVFALATSIFFLFNAALGFLRQMVNVLARSERALRVCLAFALVVSVLLTIPLIFLGWTESGKQFLVHIYAINTESLADVILYIRYLTPLVIVNALRQYSTGLLIQSKNTRRVTVLDVIHLAAIVTILLAGYHLRWKAVNALALAQVAAAVLHLVITWLSCLRLYHLPIVPEHENLTWRETFAFFWPIAITSTMFSLSRPIIYAFVSRLPDSKPEIAALRVAFDFAMIFHVPLNQFRDLFVTFGYADFKGVKRFNLKVLAVVSGTMILIAFTPLCGMILNSLLGVKGDVLSMAQNVVKVLCAIPFIVTIRNYLHGQSMVNRKTFSMAAGGVSRIIVIFFLCFGLYEYGLLNHMTAALTLVLGFSVETAAVIITTRGN